MEGLAGDRGAFISRPAISISDHSTDATAAAVEDLFTAEVQYPSQVRSGIGGYTHCQARDMIIFQCRRRIQKLSLKGNLWRVEGGLLTTQPKKRATLTKRL